MFPEEYQAPHFKTSLDGVLKRRIAANSIGNIVIPGETDMTGKNGTCLIKCPPDFYRAEAELGSCLRCPKSRYKSWYGSLNIRKKAMDGSELQRPDNGADADTESVASTIPATILEGTAEPAEAAEVPSAAEAGAAHQAPTTPLLRA